MLRYVRNKNYNININSLRNLLVNVMKKLIFCILLFSFGLSGCKASDEKEIDFFIDNNFKVYLDDDREILLTVIENTNPPSALKEAIFDKAYIKVRTVKSLLENEHGKNWVDGLNRDSLDYSNLDTLNSHRFCRHH